MNERELHFEVAPRAVLELGQELVRDERAALEELVKNGYDADARNVRVIFETVADGDVKAIRVADDGTGMTLVEVEENWLVVATPSKLKMPVSLMGRVRTGEKGIGRLSTARLGSALE